MEPVLKYPGSKWRTAQWIIGNMPRHESYVEPFAGSLAVYLNKPRTRINTLNDLDGNIVNFWRICREHPDELAEALFLTPYARTELNDANAHLKNVIDPVERARQFAVKCWMSFGASAANTGWRKTTGTRENGGPDNPKLWRRLPSLIYDAADRLMDAQIENRPALDIIQCFDGPGVLIYADPPYVMGTRTAHCDQYHYEMTDAQHMELLHALTKHKGMVLLSGYDCELYRAMLPDWELLTMDVRAARGVIRTECLWLNPSVQAAQGTQIKISGF